jgi:anti-anti-sigma regulatory factor
MTLELADVHQDQLAIHAKLVDATIEARIAGTADTGARSALEEYMTGLHREAKRLAVAAVVVDLRELEFMNSSCLKIFVAWLAQLRDLDAASQYKVRIRSNPALLWQRRSLAALSCFAIDLVTIET